MPTRKNGRLFGGNFQGITEREVGESQNFVIADPQTLLVRQVVTPHKQMQGLKTSDERHMKDNASILNYGTLNNYYDLRQQSNTGLVWGNVEAYANGEIADTAESLTVRGFRDNDGVIEFKATDADDSWTSFANISGDAAPKIAKYVVTEVNSTLENERVISASATSGLSLTENAQAGTLGVSIDASALTAVGGAVAGTDYVVIYDSQASQSKKALVSNFPFTNNTGDITKVDVAGTGLSGGGASGDITITIAPDTVAGGFSADAVANSAVAGLATVATTGDYTDLSNTPTIPTNNNQLTNGEGYTTNTGTCTSVGLSAGSLIDVSGSPVTTSGTITVNVDLSELTNSTSNADGDYFVVTDDSSGQHRLTKGNIDLTGFNNDAGWTSNAGTVTSVTAGTGLGSSGGATPSITLDFDALTEIGDNTTLVNTDEVIVLDGTTEKRINLQYIKLGLMDNDQSWTSNTGTVTASSTDTFTNKTFDGNGTGNSITNIPNASLDNSTISGKSLGSDLGTLTLGTGLTGTSYDGSSDITANVNFGGASAGSYTNADVTINDSGQVTSVSNGVDLGGSTARELQSEGQVLPAYTDNNAAAVVKFPTSTLANTDVATYTTQSGEFAIAATGTYSVEVRLWVAAADNSRDQVKLQIEWHDGVNTYTDIVSGTIANLGSNPILLQIPPTLLTWSGGVGTRTLSVKIVGASVGNTSAVNATAGGYPYGYIQIIRRG